MFVLEGLAPLNVLRPGRSAPRHSFATDVLHPRQFSVNANVPGVSKQIEGGRRPGYTAKGSMRLSDRKLESLKWLCGRRRKRCCGSERSPGCWHPRVVVALRPRLSRRSVWASGAAPRRKAHQSISRCLRARRSHGLLSGTLSAAARELRRSRTSTYRQRRTSPVFPGPVLEPFPPIDSSPTQADQTARDQVRPSTGSFFQAAEHKGWFRFGIILAAARLLAWNGQRRVAESTPFPLDTLISGVPAPIRK